MSVFLICSPLLIKIIIMSQLGSGAVATFSTSFECFTLLFMLTISCIFCSILRLHSDPYLNTDAGTMSPFEHGEVFVLDDGGEVESSFIFFNVLEKIC